MPPKQRSETGAPPGQAVTAEKKIKRNSKSPSPKKKSDVSPRSASPRSETSGSRNLQRHKEFEDADPTERDIVEDQTQRLSITSRVAREPATAAKRYSQDSMATPTARARRSNNKLDTHADVRREPLREPVQAEQQDRSEKETADNAAALERVWRSLRGRERAGLKFEDINKLLKGTGANIDAGGLRDFVMNDLGSDATGLVSDRQFLQRSHDFFETCTPSEDFTEVWQMVGGKISRDSTVQVVEIGNVLARLGCKLEDDEVADLFAYTMGSSDSVTYDDFVQTFVR